MELTIKFQLFSRESAPPRFSRGRLGGGFYLLRRVFSTQGVPMNQESEKVFNRKKSKNHKATFTQYNFSG